ncbi:hypothetical protein PT974_04796 [Cladobotryum mycophilum]|uniref:Cyclase n=1 Tax=Cladobotryum mycophilum TaxID=491253 RepID=A0ABR0SQE2_9HYPO
MEHALKQFPNGLPTLEEIRARNKDSDIPSDAAWIWGKEDDLGRLNLLTPERIFKAKQNEILSGEVVSLNWALNLPEKPLFGRTPCTHRFQQHEFSPVVYDDWIDMNVQCGSQWDGFRHFGIQSHVCFYNGLKHDQFESSTRGGMQAFSDHGIVGRGVLLDYYSWKTKKGEPYDPFTSHAIHVDELLAVAKDQNVTFEQGDILLVRSGYTDAYYKNRTENPEKLDMIEIETVTLAGLARTEEMKTWLHDSYFSAVAGDSPTCEVWPFEEWALHEYILGCWGIPIGEFFDLEALSKKCEERKKWTFLFASTPFNSPGGVASLANAITIL